MIKKKLNFNLKASMLAIATFAMMIISCGDEESSSKVELPPLKVTPSTLSLLVGDKGTVGANLAPVTWSSSATSVVSVDAASGEVTALALGTATITASTTDGQSSTCSVTVNPVNVANISITPRTASIEIDSTVQLTATPTPENVTVFEPVWTSSNKTVASVSETGLVTGLFEGTTTITVTAGGVSQSIEVTVFAAGESLLQIVKGLWTFDNPYDPTEAVVGQPLQPMGAYDGFIPDAGSLTIKKGSYGKILHGISPNGGGSRVNEYTFLIDCKLTQLTGGAWYGLIQTNLDNTDNNDIWINTSNGQIGCGDIEYSGDNGFPIENSNFHRVVVVAQLPTTYSIYVDGIRQLSATPSIDDVRRSLSADGVLLFADNEGSDTDIVVSTVAIWDKALNAQQIASLGDAE
jgi:hypothetical protein